MTLATWCMFAQVLPLFQLSNTFSVLPSLYGGATKAGVKALDLYNAAITCHTTGASAGDDKSSKYGFPVGCAACYS